MHHPQANIGIQLRDLTRAIHLGVDQGMRETEIVVAHILVVMHDIVPKARIILGKVVRADRKAHEIDIQEIGRASHHAAGGVGPGLDHGPPSDQILDAARNNERRSFALAGVRGKIGQSVTRRRVMLHVIQVGQCVRAIGQCWMAHDIIDLFTVEPDVTPPLP